LAISRGQVRFGRRAPPSLPSVPTWQNKRRSLHFAFFFLFSSGGCHTSLRKVPASVPLIRGPIFFSPLAPSRFSLSQLPFLRFRRLIPRFPRRPGIPGAFLLPAAFPLFFAGDGVAAFRFMVFSLCFFSAVGDFRSIPRHKLPLRRLYPLRLVSHCFHSSCAACAIVAMSFITSSYSTRESPDGDHFLTSFPSPGFFLAPPFLFFFARSCLSQIWRSDDGFRPPFLPRWTAVASRLK